MDLTIFKKIVKLYTIVGIGSHLEYGKSNLCHLDVTNARRTLAKRAPNHDLRFSLYQNVM